MPRMADAPRFVIEFPEGWRTLPGNPDARYWWPDPDAEPVDPGPLPEGWVDVGYTEVGVSTERDFNRQAMERYETLTGMGQSTDERIASARRAIANLLDE